MGKKVYKVRSIKVETLSGRKITVSRDALGAVAIGGETLSPKSAWRLFQFLDGDYR